MFQPILQDSTGSTFVFRYEKTKMEILFFRNCNHIIITLFRCLIFMGLFMPFLVFDMYHKKPYWLSHIVNINCITWQIYLTLSCLAFHLVDLDNIVETSKSWILYSMQILCITVPPVTLATFLEILSHKRNDGEKIEGEMEIAALTSIAVIVELTFTLHYMDYVSMIYPLMYVFIYFLPISVGKALESEQSLETFPWVKQSWEIFTEQVLSFAAQVVMFYIVITLICQKKYKYFTNPNQIFWGYVRLISDTEEMQINPGEES